MLKTSQIFGQYPRYFLFFAMISALLLTGCGGSSYGDDKVIADTVAPVITLTGEAEVNVLVNGTYTDAGATATDNVDGTISVSNYNSNFISNLTKNNNHTSFVRINQRNCWCCIICVNI